MAAAAAYFFKTGATLYWGDAEAHLDIARRIVDSRTPGWNQIGTTWLPLPHILMLPLVRNAWLWQTGLAGGIVSAACTVVAVTFLFAALRRLFESDLAGWTGAAVFLLNPNTLYLGSIPMTEAVFFASLFALLYFTVRFAETRGWGALIGAGLAGFAGTLTRYEAWFLLPFAALYLLMAGSTKRWTAAIVFCFIAGAGPLLWFFHNWYYFQDPLYFYRGPWSALAIQGSAPYPGRNDWYLASRYFLEGGRWIAGSP
ncbi:MAG: glycosyltransferase family 39 protein, partial [Acidobacteriota bacterium]|nr:glycosyltransferase family 39 protein [Acidobacteriota bacterium]